mgnify:CR=1 FL=1
MATDRCAAAVRPDHTARTINMISRCSPRAHNRSANHTARCPNTEVGLQLHSSTSTVPLQTFSPCASRSMPPAPLTTCGEQCTCGGPWHAHVHPAHILQTPLLFYTTHPTVQHTPTKQLLAPTMLWTAPQQQRHRPQTNTPHQSCQQGAGDLRTTRRAFEDAVCGAGEREEQPP